MAASQAGRPALPRVETHHPARPTASFQNSATVLSIGIFFTLIIFGLVPRPPAAARKVGDCHEFRGRAVMSIS